MHCIAFLPLQLIFLSATFPPSLVEKLKYEFKVGNISITRQSTDRCNLRYRVINCCTDKLEENVIREMRQLLLKGKEKGIVFVRYYQHVNFYWTILKESFPNISFFTYAGSFS